MQQYLILNWDLGMAMAEMVSSFLLVFAVFVFKANLKCNKKLAIAFGVSTLFAVALGWSLGSQISGRGHGLSFISPISAILMSFHYQAFGALWFIIIFQIIGTIIGSLFFVAYKYLLMDNKTNKNSTIVMSHTKTASKAAIFQPILLLSIFYIPTLDWTSYSTGFLLNTVLLSMVISLILYWTHSFNFLIFSPWMSLAIIFVEGFKNKNLKKELINFVLELYIQMLIVIVITTIDVYAFKGLY